VPDIDAVEFARCRTMIAERVNRLRIRPPNQGNACAVNVLVLRLCVFGAQLCGGLANTAWRVWRPLVRYRGVVKAGLSGTGLSGNLY
jgi:hypothetical protein